MQGQRWGEGGVHIVRPKEVRMRRDASGIFMGGWSRRDVLKAGVLTCATLLASPFTGVGWAAPRRIRFGVQTTGTIEGIMWAADPTRWAQKYDIDVETVAFASGRPSMEAIMSGAIDIVTSGFGPVISLIAAQPSKYAFLAMYANGDYHATLVKPDSPYTKMDELVGKKIGMRIGSGSYISFLQLLVDRGWKETDFKVVNMDPSDMGAALTHGLIDAMHSWEPTPSIVEAKKLARRIQSYAKYVWAVMPIFTSREFAERNRDVVVRLLAAVMESQDLARSDPAKAAEAGAGGLKKKGVEVPPEALESLIRRMNWDPEITERLRAEMDQQAKVLFEMGRIKALPRFDVDLSYLEQAKKLRARG